MKKTISIIAMAALCLNFCAKGQAQTKQTVQTDESQTPIIQPIQIGQKVPDLTINNIYNYKINKAKLSDFEGQLLILDFWATWCSPCVAMIPRMDSLQKAFNGNVQFLSVTFQTENEVVPFLERLEQKKKKHYDIPVVIANTELQKLFPHTTLPHYVWIDKDGIVRAITGMEDVNYKTIEKALNNDLAVLKEKKEIRIPYTNKEQLFINKNGGDGSKIRFHSVLSDYVDGLEDGYNLMIKDSSANDRIVCRNLSLDWIFGLAYSDGIEYFGPGKKVYEVGDITKIFSDKSGREYRDWQEAGNAFCYEISVPASLSLNIFKLMREDLQKLFPQYKGSIERRKIKSLALVRIGNSKKMISKGGVPEIRFDSFGCSLQNVSLSYLIMQMNVIYLQNSEYSAVDLTGLKVPVDLKIEVSLSNIEKVNQSLKKYDLKFVLANVKTNVLVIRDSIQKPSRTKI